MARQPLKDKMAILETKLLNAESVVIDLRRQISGMREKEGAHDREIRNIESQLWQARTETANHKANLARCLGWIDAKMDRPPMLESELPF